jgi:adenylate cyclase class 2
MNEIEVKAYIKDKPTLLEKLNALGIQLSPPVTQYDRIFLPVGASQPTKPGESALRIREQNGTFLFTVKQTQSNDLDCIEKEVEVSDKQATMLLQSFPLIGFIEVPSVRKTRQKAKYHPPSSRLRGTREYEICIDTVDGLGEFIEVEKMTEEVDGEKIQEELFQFLETLGVSRSDRALHGYDVLLNQKKNQTS